MRIVRGGAELLPRLEPLWLALYEHHGREAAHAGLPARDRSESWPLRRAHYAHYLAERPVAILLAILPGVEDPVGYALAFPEAPIPLISPGPTVLLESLSLLPEARGHGIGPSLMAAVDAIGAAEWGATTSALEVLAGNASARRFYLREGCVPVGETWLRIGEAGSSTDVAPDPRGIAALAGAHGSLDVSVELGPDDTWPTSESILFVQPRDAAVDPARFARDLDEQLATGRAAGAWSTLAYLGHEAEALAELRTALTAAGFAPVLEKLARPIG